MAEAEEPTKLAHEERESFEFVPNSDGTELDLSDIILQALGAASLCWTKPPVGVFESERAAEIGNRVIELIQDRIARALEDNRKMEMSLADVTAPTLSIKLHNTTDARIWAQEWIRINGAKIAKMEFSPSEAEHIMVGWFANAIETGRALGQPKSMAVVEDRFLYRATIRLNPEDRNTEPNVAEMGVLVEDAIEILQGGATSTRKAITKDGRSYVLAVIADATLEEPQHRFGIDTSGIMEER